MNSKKQMVLEMMDKTIAEQNELINKLLVEFDAADANGLWRQQEIMNKIEASRDYKRRLENLKALLQEEA